MSTLTFFFDPLCAWTWRASEWIREVQRQQPLDVEWRAFSLAEANNIPSNVARLPLRVAALARREGGNEAVNRVYQAFGRAIHESGSNARDQAALQQAIQRAVDSGEIAPDLPQRAQDDPSTWQDVLTDHREAERLGAYASPWLVLDDKDFGFNGPIMTEVPRGDAATELWRSVSWLLAQPYFYELKRQRR